MQRHCCECLLLMLLHKMEGCESTHIWDVPFERKGGYTASFQSVADLLQDKFGLSWHSWLLLKHHFSSMVHMVSWIEVTIWDPDRCMKGPWNAKDKYNSSWFIVGKTFGNFIKCQTRQKKTQNENLVNLNQAHKIILTEKIGTFLKRSKSD